ncbi:hypothetical protein BC835DRAFT_1275268 [Cytidiella melzeri]|nr:hypothetical protein BC835DRAFT_1275268 [Cytidiella melzeri]
MQAAHNKLTSAHKRHEPTDIWRRIYTDACISRSLADILSSDNEKSLEETLSASCIARLDCAIIIAGPCGEGRLDLILELIAEIQSCTLWTKEHAPFGTLQTTELTPIHLPKTFVKSIPRIDLRSLPSLSAFTSTFFREPFILSGYVQDWPAMQEHPWHSMKYLRQVAGPGRVVPVEVGSDYRADDWTHTLMSWDKFLSSLDVSFSHSHEGESQKHILYLAQHNLFAQFPALRNDIIIPDYAYAAPAVPDSHVNYRPPANDEQLVINAWLGPAGTVSPAHTDPFYNLYAQVVGRKTVWLSPPETTPYMYPYQATPKTDVCEESTPLFHSNPAANHVEPLMSNTSQIDVFTSGSMQIPLFAENAVPHAICATLDPGDLLYFPPGWWHAMRSEDTSFSVSMWF